MLSLLDAVPFQKCATTLPKFIDPSSTFRVPRLSESEDVQLYSRAFRIRHRSLSSNGNHPSSSNTLPQAHKCDLALYFLLDTDYSFPKAEAQHRLRFSI